MMVWQDDKMYSVAKPRPSIVRRVGLCLREHGRVGWGKGGVIQQETLILILSFIHDKLQINIKFVTYK